MKKWILEHKKLYFFIVGFIAFLAFTIITLIGLGKVYDAEAATDNGSISVPYGESSTYSLGLRDYPYYVVFTTYLNDTERFVAILSDEPMTYGNGFSDTDLLSGGVRTLYVRREENGDGEYVVSEEAIEGNMSIRYLPQESSEVYSNYDIMRGSYEVVFPANPCSFTVELDILHGLERHVENVVFTEILSDGVAKWQVTYDSIPELQYPLPNTYSLYSAHRFRVPPLTYLQFLKGEEILESDVSEWRESRTYFEEYEFTFETSYSGILDLYEASRSALVSQWFDIYGVELDSELLDIALRYAYPHVSIFRPLEILDGVLYGGNSNICYAQSIYMGYDDNLEIVLYEDISGHGFDSILDMAADSLYEDSDELKSQLESALSELEATKAALAETQKKLEEAREELEAALKTDLSSFLNFFSDIAKGFEAATESVGAIGRGISKVFSFLPVEIRVGLYFALPFLIFVAIYKAIKS